MTLLQPVFGRMRHYSRYSRGLLWGLAALIVFLLVAAWTRNASATLGQPDLISGYALFAGVLMLAAFNVRKRLSTVRFLKASVWKSMHVYGGVLVLGLYWVHAGTAWPIGTYEQVLAGLFYLVSLSGILGLLCQHVYPRRLAQTGIEIIYERIPEEISLLRDRAERTVLECTRNTGTDTLAQFYIETLQWFFRQPRFLLSHLWGGHRANFWVTQQLSNAGRHLGDQEAPFLDELTDLAHAKASLDLHYATQGLLKIWLLVHLPMAVAMYVLVGWHLLVTNVYAI